MNVVTKMITFAKDAPEGAIRACTVSDGIEKFDLLIEDMDQLLGENWGDLGIEDALKFFTQPDGKHVEFIALAVNNSNTEQTERLTNLVNDAADRGIKVIVVADGVGPVVLHSLLKAGADAFLPYPLPRDELRSAVDKALTLTPPINYQAGNTPFLSRNGYVITFQGMAGGVGSSMIAANTAWEFSHPDKKSVPLKTLLIDLDLQFGSISTYLDVESKNAVLQMLSDTEALDEDSFSQAITKLSEHFSVLTAPPEIVPYDLLGDEDIDRILKLARRHFDLIIIDMPKSVTTWTDAVLRESDEFIAILDLDMRSTNNVIRLINLLEQEKQPFSKMRYVLNRAPKFTDLSGKSRIKRLSDALGIEFEFMLPDGGKPISTSCDQGEALATSAAKNPLRKDLLKMVKTLYDQLPQELKAA